jgi:hypothetical protein
MNDAESMKPILKETYPKKMKKPRFSKLLDLVKKNEKKPEEPKKKKS